MLLHWSFNSQSTRNWPLIAPLPSYGRGRELSGGRHMSFIHGDGLRDVIITGASLCLNHGIRNVVVRHVTILAPYDSPNTDGVDPDSSSNVCIEDSYISTGDDLVDGMNMALLMVGQALISPSGG